MASSDLLEIGTFLYPLGPGFKSHLLRDSWYPIALRDQTFMTATLWCAAEHLCDRGISSWSKSKEDLESSLLQQVSNKVAKEGIASDGTLSAVSCLAMTGVRF
jgi:hypothetical protein